MANRNFPSQRLFNFHLLPVSINGGFTISGTAGAPTLDAASLGIKAVVRKAAGVYQIQLQDNYFQSTGFQGSMRGGFGAASAVDPHGATVGNLYQITTVGDTNWATAGIPSGITPTIGQVFVLAAQPGAGTGRVKAYTPSAIDNIQQAGGFNDGLVAGSSGSAYLAKKPFQAGSGGFVTIITCSNGTATDPADGEKVYFQLWFNNSSIQ